MTTPRSPWGRPGVVALVLLACVLLHAPSLGWGFFADDWAHRLALENPEPATNLRPWGLYDFGDVATNGAAAYEDGIFPWWVDPSWKARFFRPLSSLVLAAEHGVLGRNAPVQHALGLLWHGLFLLLAWRLYRAVGLGSGVALLGVVLLAVEDGSSMTVGWLANRNSVLEGVFSAGALLCAFRARAHPHLGTVSAALFLATMAVLCKESGIAALLLCAALLGTGAPGVVRRGGGVAALLALLHLSFLGLGGYGVHSRFYATPWEEPLAWARHFLGMASAGWLGAFGPFPVDALVLSPEGYWPLVLTSALLLGCGARGWFGAMRSFRGGSFLAAFALVSILPQTCAPPSDRLLYVPMLGLAPITAVWLARLTESGAARRVWGLRLVALCALPLSALMLVVRGTFLIGVSEDLQGAFLEAELEHAPPERRDVFLLQSPSVLATLSPLAAWRFLTGDWNTRLHAVQYVRRGLSWRRLDETRFELESLDGPFLDTLFEGVFLTASPLEAGARYRSAAFEVELLDASPLRRIRVTCAESLESARFVFLSWSDGRWRRLAVPGVGETIEVPMGQPLHPLLP